MGLRVKSPVERAPNLVSFTRPAIKALSRVSLARSVGRGDGHVRCAEGYRKSLDRPLAGGERPLPRHPDGYSHECEVHTRRESLNTSAPSISRLRDTKTSHTEPLWKESLTRNNTR